jgi:Ribbon-helix-helix protein, copG family
LKKIVGFSLEQEDEAHLQQLTAKLGWNRSQIVRELLRRAVIEGQPSISVVLPTTVPGEAEEAHVG